MDQDDKAYTECTPEAFRQALHYLHEEALAAGWMFPAHFIAVAAEAMRAYDPASAESGRKPCIVIPFERPAPADPGAADESDERERGRW